VLPPVFVLQDYGAVMKKELINFHAQKELLDMVEL
jgi:hypothetical protein